jgi:hypothetical protein
MSNIANILNRVAGGALTVGIALSAANTCLYDGN